MDIEWVGMDIRVKLVDSRSNRSRDIRLPDFVTDYERTTADAGRDIRQKRHSTFCQNISNFTPCLDKLWTMTVTAPVFW